MTKSSTAFVLTCSLLLAWPLAASSAEQEAATEVDILAPRPADHVHGTVKIRVRITPPDGRPQPTTVRGSIAGPPWVALHRLANGDEWAGVFDSTMVPNGTQSLRIVTNDRKARAEVDVRVENPLRVYFADLHSHSSYSDGTLTPKDAHDDARDVAKLDVFCLTDHLEYVDELEWLDVREQAWDANEDGRFVAFPGLEWTKGWGHLNIYDPKMRRWPEGPAEFYKSAANAGVVVKFIHPGDGSKTHDGLAYSEVGDQAVQLMEVRHATEEKALIRALNNGWHIAPDGSDDTHRPNWGNVRSWTRMLMPGLSKRNVLDALKKRRVYSTLDRNCKLFFMVNGGIMGDPVDELSQIATVSVKVEDPDPNDAIAQIEFILDGQVVGSAEPGKPRCELATDWELSEGKHYCFVKITQTDGNMLWSAPVWLTSPGN
jgi:hypothetical protein